MSLRDDHGDSHCGESGFDPEFLLGMAKRGDGAALGRLLEIATGWPENAATM